MAKLTLQGGVYTAVASLVFTGGGTAAVTTAWTLPWYLGWLSIAVGVGLLVWGIRWRGRPWWKSVFRRSSVPSLYLSAPPGKSGSLGTMYILKWDPEMLEISFNGDGPFSEWPPPEPIERSMIFNLLNVGSDARHIEITFCLDADLATLIQESKLFGDSLHSFDNGALRLIAPNRGSSQAVLTEVASGPIPIIKTGDQVKVAAPAAFTRAFSIYALAKAKQHHEVEVVPTLNDTLDHLKYLETSQVALQGVSARVRYVSEDQRYTHTFDIFGWLSGGSKATSVKQNDEGAYYTIEGSVQAGIYNVTVIMR